MKTGSSSDDFDVFGSIPDYEYIPSVPAAPDVSEAPRYSISQYTKCRDKVLKAVLDVAGGLDSTATPDALMAVAKATYRLLLVDQLYLPAVYETLRHSFLTERMDRKTLFRMAVRLAGNREELRKGRMIPLWKGSDLKWAAVAVLDSSISIKRPMSRVLRMFVHEGEAAGLELRQTLNDKFLQYMLRSVGYPRYKRFGSEEVMGLWLTCLLGVIQGRPAMTAFCASSSQLERNRNLYKLRHGACPKNKSCECFQCASGKSDCPAAVHSASWAPVDCEHGHRSLGVPGARLCAMCSDAASRRLGFKFGKDT